MDLRTVLSDLGLSQQAAADKLGVTRETVSRWITGKSPLPDDVLDRLGAPQVEDDPFADPEPAKPTGRTMQHEPGHMANSTPIPHVGDIVRIAPPHGGPWMQVRWIEDGLYNCWFEQDGTRYAADYSLERLETLYADRKAAGIVWPPKIEALPISSFPAKPYVAQKAKEGVHRFGVVQAE
jgi:hypothetical protein